MRAPFEILAIPFRKISSQEMEFCVFHRADFDQWQFVSGGGEKDEAPTEAAKREIWEETGIKTNSIIKLTSMTYIPENIFPERYRKYWAKNTYVIPEYHFAFECVSDIKLSNEHIGCEWLRYEDAVARLSWGSNKTALYELRCLLLEEA